MCATPLLLLPWYSLQVVEAIPEDDGVLVLDHTLTKQHTWHKQQPAHTAEGAPCVSTCSNSTSHTGRTATLCCR